MAGGKISLEDFQDIYFGGSRLGRTDRRAGVIRRQVAPAEGDVVEQWRPRLMSTMSCTCTLSPPRASIAAM